jgi:hypothetical protein
MPYSILNMSNQIQNNYFPCYSPNLYKYLKYNHNIPYIIKGINPNTNKTYWLFETTDQLQQILNQWSANKQLHTSTINK